MTRDDIEAIRQELKGIKSAIAILAGSDSTANSENQVIGNNILTTINTSLDVIEANSAVGTSFLTPLRALSSSDALTFACISAASSVYVNAQGYVAP